MVEGLIPAKLFELPFLPELREIMGELLLGAGALMKRASRIAELAQHPSPIIAPRHVSREDAVEGHDAEY